VEALWTDNDWLEYRLRAVRDALLDQGAQTTEGGSVVDMVKAALLERDEALQKARAALAEAQTAAAEMETTLAPTQAQLQQDRATLERALLTVYFGTPNMFITLWFGFDYGTNPPLGTLII
jgi:hypothetical protein